MGWISTDLEEHAMSKYTVDAKEVHSTLTKYILADGFHLTIDLEKSHGSWIYDAVEEREILDCYSYFASLPIGHNHPKLKKDPDFIAALTRAAVANPANSDIYTKEYAAFVKRFAELAMPGEFRYLFFVAGGALAVENALKTAFDWKVGMNKAQRGHARGSKIIHFKEAFHGRSGYTLSLTNTDPTKTEGYPQFDWPRIVNPKLEFPATPERVQRVMEQEKEAVAQIEKAFADHPDDIVAIIIEPIQGEGGDNHFRKEFFQELRRLADENQALLIFDEVQTGVGLTGKFWAHQHFGVSPDILVFGKKTQVCGIMVSDRVDSYEDNVFHTPSRINSTWGGNLTDMLRGVRYLEIIAEDKLVENAARMGDRLLKGLQELAKKHPGMTNVRGLGLFCAFDVADGKTRDKLRQACWDFGLASLSCGSRSLRFRPCLTISAEEITKVLTILEKALVVSL
jgi:L-lysine 6-transaminase